MKDTNDFYSAISEGNLPHVSWIKPMSPHNFHPHNSDRDSSQAYLKNVIDTVQASEYWNRTMIIVTFDEHGGFFDHVPPPKGDRWGPGSRVPTIVVSPYAKKGYVDHTETETISIHRLFQRKFFLPQFGIRSAKNDLTSCLEEPLPSQSPTPSPSSSPPPTPSTSFSPTSPSSPSPSPSPAYSLFASLISPSFLFILAFVAILHL